MSNAVIKLHGTDARARRAQWVHDQLSAERWTIRQAAIRVGMSNSALGQRLSGSVAFTAEDLPEIARLLKREPVAFYADYLAAADYDGGSEPPAGIEPATYALRERRSAD